MIFGARLLPGADTAEALFQRAASALSSEDYASAERDFQAVLKLEPRNVGALGNLGVVYSRTHRYADAIGVYRRALQSAPGDPALATNLGLVYVKQEQFRLALPIFAKLAGDPRNLQARELYATCLLQTGSLESAGRELESLRSAEPGNPGVLYLLGLTLTKLKRPDEAHAAFAEMMSSATPAQANMLMGKASYETEKFEEAAAYFRKALEADPKLQDAHRELGKTLISLRENDAAESELRQTDPEDSEALYYLGGLLAQANNPDAVPILEKARRLNPDFWGPAYYLGKIEIDQGQTAKGLRDLERAARLRPDESAVQYQLGRAYQKAGRAAEAKAAFDRVKQLKANSLQKEVDVLSPEKP